MALRNDEPNFMNAVGFIVAAAIFVWAWAYCAMKFGYIGFTLGFMPAFGLAAIAVYAAIMLRET